MVFLEEDEVKEIEKQLKKIIGEKEEISLEKTRKILDLDYPKITQFAMQTDYLESQFEFDFEKEKIRKKKGT